MNINDFTIGELTTAINAFPVAVGRINQLGLFSDRGVRTPNVTIEDRNGALGLLTSHDWGGEGSNASAIVRNTYAFAIKQTVHDDLVLPSDVMGVRGFGTEGLDSMAQEVALRLQRMKAKHDQTLEYKRIGALKGNVLNADGTSSLANLFQTFGINQATVDFALGTATTDILAKCSLLANQVEDNLKGELHSGIRVLVSPEFYSKLINHANVKDAYKYHSEASTRLGTDLRKGFTFGGITFEEYRYSINGTRMINANEGHAFPEGTSDVFATYYAPADFNEAVNTVGQAIYVKQWEKEGGRGIVLHSQCNSLPLCHQPAVLVKVITSN